MNTNLTRTKPNHGLSHSGTALRQFRQRAVAYEDWRVPISPEFRRAIILSFAAQMVGFVSLLLLPAMIRLSYSDFFFGDAKNIRGFLYLMLEIQPWLMCLIVASMIAYGPLLAYTDQLQSGHIRWHHLAIGQVVFGSINGVLVGLEVLVLLVHAIAWLLIGALAIAAILGGLAGLGGSTSRR